MVVIILLIVAAVLFALAGFNVASSRVNLVALGLLALTLSLLIPKLT